MAGNLHRFRTFPNRAQAEEVATILNENGIFSRIVVHRMQTDLRTLRTPIDPSVELLLHPDDFDRAGRILFDLIEANLDSIGPDHYLFSFSNEELLEVVSKPDEWSLTDHVLAQKILKNRGHTIDHKKQEALREQRIEDLSKPIPGPAAWIFAGYIFALGGGLIGIFAGWHFGFNLRTLPNGKRAFVYTPNTRFHGRVMFWLGVAVFGGATLVQIFTDLDWVGGLRDYFRL